VGGDFDRELKKVIFSHIPESDRLEFEDLDSLLKHHTGLVEASLKRLRDKVFELNEEIVELEDKTSEAEIKKLSAQIQSQSQVIDSHEESKPIPVTQPEGQSQQAQKLEEDREIIETLKVQFEHKKDLLSQAKKRKSTVTQIIGELKQQYDAIENQRNSLSQRLHQTGITASLENMLKISLDVSPLEEIKEAVNAEIKDLERDLDPETPDGLFSTLEQKQEEVRQIQEELNTADRAYQLYVTSQQEWETTKQRLIGSPEEVGSLNFLIEKKRIYEEDYPLRLEGLKAKRTELVNSIYFQLEELKKIYRDLAYPVQQSMDKHCLTQEQYGLDFKVRLVLPEFLEHFLDFIHQGRAG
jgi:tetrahydromethanopterin S-methyltransferase subunit B